MNITIEGNIFGTSGFANHTRNLVNALYKIHQDIKLDTPLIQNWNYQVNTAELNMIKKPYQENTFLINIGLPQYWNFSLAKNPKYFGGFIICEGDKIPKFWLNNMLNKKVNLLFCPSNHVKQAIKNTCTKNEWSILKEKIKIIPHGVDLNLFKPCKNKD